MAATAADMVTVVPEAWRLSAVGVGERLEALPVCVGGGMKAGCSLGIVGAGVAPLGQKVLVHA